MSKIKWKNKADIEQEKIEREQVKTEKEKHKGKEFKNLSTKEKDEILEKMAIELGYL